MPAHTNVCDAHLSYLGAADFYAFASIEVYDMNSLWCGLGDWLNNHIFVNAVVNLVIK